MKTCIALAAAIVGGLALSACGSGSKMPSSFDGPTTSTFTTAKTGDLIRCNTSNGLKLRANVPSPGNGVANNSDGPSASGSLQLTRKQDGSLIVICKP